MNDIKVIQQETNSILTKAQDFRIINNEIYKKGADFLKDIKGLQKKIDDTFDPIITKAYQAHKEAVAQKKRYLEPLQNAESIVKGKLLTYQQAQEEIRRKEEARLQELARKEEERKRKALEERAKRAEGKGHLEKAEALRQQKEEVFVPTPIIEKQVPKAEGVSRKKIWKFRIVDIAQVPRGYLIPNDVMLGNIARATKGTLAIPGVEIYSEDVIASGR